MKVSFQQVEISARLLTAMNESPTADLGRKTVFVHDTPSRLAVVMRSILPFDPDLYSAATIDRHKTAPVPAFSDLFQQNGFTTRILFAFKVPVISVAGYLEKLTHTADWILGR